MTNGDVIRSSKRDKDLDSEAKASKRYKRTKSREEHPRTKSRPKRLSRPYSPHYRDGGSNGFTGLPPTPMENSGFAMPSPREMYYSGQNGYSSAPVLTPPVSPAVSSPMPRGQMHISGQALVTYTAFSSGKRSCAYENREPDPSPEMIDKLVSQHFQSCGLGGYVNPEQMTPVTKNNNNYMPPRQVCNHRSKS